MTHSLYAVTLGWQRHKLGGENDWGGTCLCVAVKLCTMYQPG